MPKILANLCAIVLVTLPAVRCANLYGFTFFARLMWNLLNEKYFRSKGECWCIMYESMIVVLSSLIKGDVARLMVLIGPFEVSDLHPPLRSVSLKKVERGSTMFLWTWKGVIVYLTISFGWKSVFFLKILDTYEKKSKIFWPLKDIHYLQIKRSKI